MTSILSGNIAALRKHLGMNQGAFAAAVGSEQPNVSKWESQGKVPTGAPLARMAELAGVSVHEFVSRSWSPPGKAIVAPDHMPTRSADGGETAKVMRMDLSYAMGPGTNIDEDYIEGEPVELDIGFLRRLTPSAPEMLRIVNGIGDSMQPTIHDSEELILDLGQRRLNMQDRIWAMSLYGVGAVKRLKAIGKDRILVISDNQDVPDQEVSAEDIVLVGRVVGSIRRH